MSITHHPSDALLLDYASGAMTESWSLAVATHAALCPDCRGAISLLEDVGGELMDSLAPEPLETGSFNAVMAKLETDGANVASVRPAADRSPAAAPVLPQPLRGYLGSDADGLRWQPLGLGAYQLIVPTGDAGATARLLRIPAGRPVPQHSHGGLELTLVLSGAFSDATGRYARGDLQEADETLEHRPHAAPGADCVCLAVTDAPLRFRNLVVRLIQPWLKI